MWRQKYPDISVFRKIKRLIEENRPGGHWKPLFFPENRRIPHEIRLRAQKKTRSSVIGDGSERLSVFYLLCHICGRMNLTPRATLCGTNLRSVRNWSFGLHSRQKTTGLRFIRYSTPTGMSTDIKNDIRVLNASFQ